MVWLLPVPGGPSINRPGVGRRCQPQRGFKAGAGRRQNLELAQVFADGLAHERDMEKHRGAVQFVLVGRHVHAARGQADQAARADRGQHPEGIHHIGGPDRRASQQFVGGAAPALAGLGTQHAFKRRVEPYFLAFAIEGQPDLAARARLQQQRGRPQQQRNDAGARGAARIAAEQERKTQIQPIDAGVALVQRALPCQGHQAGFQQRVALERFGVQLHGARVALQQVIEQRGGGSPGAIHVVHVHACGGLADTHAHQRATHHRGDHFLFEEVQDLRDVLLLLRLQPAAGGHGQHHQGARQRHAPFQPELLGPAIHHGQAGAGEAQDARVHAAIQLGTRVL